MKLFVFLMLTLSATLLDSQFRNHRWIIWNVGQGQWVTRIQNDQCLHFDLGGEKFPLNRLRYYCGRKQNKIFISHWDWDHVGALPKLQRLAPKSCLALRPTGSHRRQKMLKNLKACPIEGQDMGLFKGPRHKLSNSQSHVISFDNFLLPGDSPLEQERKWIQQIAGLRTTRVLVLGHHGSRTSTSSELLQRLPNLKMAVASARWKRYKHPHAEVQNLLQDFKVPLIRTEDWGNLHFLD